MSDSISDIDPLARAAYSHGTDPINWAIQLAEDVIGWRDTIVAGRLEKPGSFPGYRLGLDTPAVARRIIGHLLDAGWTPPTIDKSEMETTP